MLAERSRICKGCWQQLHLSVRLRGIVSLPFGIFGIRPEVLSDLERVNTKSKILTTFISEVEIVEPAGSDTFVVTSIAGKVVTARMRSDSDIRVGESHVFALDLDKAVLFDPATTHRI